MFKLCAIVCLFGGSFGFSENQSKPGGRIVGGSDANIEDFPYQISLQSYEQHVCGGSIISSIHILTAAHCTDGNSASQLSIRAGSSYHRSGGVVMKVSRIFQHPRYSGSTIDYDISILELAKTLTYGVTIKPISLTSSDPTSEGRSIDCVVSGWGRLWENGPLPEQLQRVDVHLFSRISCKSFYGSSKITDRMICAGTQFGGMDSCQGNFGIF